MLAGQPRAARDGWQHDVATCRCGTRTARSRRSTRGSRPTARAIRSRSLVAFGDGLGVYPKWPIAIGESGTMLGASAEIVIADAVARGVRCGESAWPMMRAAAMDPTPPSRGGRDDVVDVHAVRLRAASTWPLGQRDDRVRAR